MSHRKSACRVLVTLMVGFALGIGASSTVVRADADGPTIDKADITEEVRKELRRLINDEGFMDRAIEKGIKSYIQRQQAAAAAEKSRAGTQNAKRFRPFSAKRDHIYGDPDAPISLVEYSDFECPFCKRFHPTAKKLIEQNMGKVNWVYRHFPLEFHNPSAQKEAEATECAALLGGNDLFWRYTDLIYQRTTSNGNGFSGDKLIPLAEEIGLDGKAFGSCLTSGRMAGRVREDYQDGATAGITGTPGLILISHDSGTVFATAGALPLARLQVAVDNLLSEQPAKKKE